MLLNVFDTIFQVSQSFRRIIPAIKNNKTFDVSAYRTFKRNSELQLQLEAQTLTCIAF